MGYEGPDRREPLPDGLAFRLGQLESTATRNANAIHNLTEQVAILVYEANRRTNEATTRMGWMPAATVGILASLPGYLILFIH